jgi:hypothetical protein
MPKRTKPRTPPKIDLPRYAEEHLLYEAQMFVMARSMKCVKPSFEMNLQTEACRPSFQEPVRVLLPY